MKPFSILSLAVVSLVLGGCPDQQRAQTPTKATQAEKAQQAANSISFTENAEIDNIKRRLELTSKPDLLGYIAIINRVGAIVLYTPVKGKVTSGSKRLTKPWINGCATGNDVPCGEYPEGPSDEGTFGSSNPYVYFWTQTGRYIQTDMEYIYSDQPLRLDNETVAINLAVTAKP